MYIKSKTVAMIFRVIFILACIGGIVLKILNHGFGMEMIFADWSMIANFLALVYFIFLVIAKPTDEKGALRGSIMLYLIITFFAYYFSKFGIAGNPLNNMDLIGVLMYYATPIIAVLDYLLFCKKGSYSPFSPVFWMIIPIIVNLAVFLMNMMGWAPKTMPFMTIMGVDIVLTFMIFLGVSYIMFIIDRILSGRKG